MLTVRSAEPGDALQVAQVHVRSWQAGYRDLLPSSYLDGLRPEDRAGRYRFGGSSPDDPTTIVVEDDGAIRGFATTGRAADVDGREVGELLALYVDPDCWRQGVGRRLLHVARQRLADGLDQAILWVLAGNERAERFYRADGWRADGGRRQDEVWGIGVDEVRYRRALP